MRIAIKRSARRSDYEEKQAPDLCWKLLALAVFFSPLRCYGLFTFGTFTGSLFKIFSLLMIVCTFGNLLIGRYKLYADTPVKIITAIIVFDLFTFAHSSSMGLFPTYFVAHIILLFSYIVMQNASGHIETLLKAYVFGSVIPGTLGLYQWINVMTGRGVPQLPFQRFLVTAGKDEIFLYGNYRVVGTLQDPSYYGLYMASVFIICVGLIINQRKNAESKTESISMLLIAIMSVACIFSSGSVTSMVNALAGLVFILLFNRNGLSKVVKYAFSIGIALIAALYLMIYVFNYNPLEVLLSKLLIQSTASSVGSMYGRGIFFSDAINDFWRSPIWGVGFGNMTRSSGHNSFLTILALQGLIGIVPHVILVLVYPFFSLKARMLFKNKSSVRNTLVICCAALFGMIVQIMGYDCLYKMDPTILVLLFPIATIRIGVGEIN